MVARPPLLRFHFAHLADRLFPAQRRRGVSAGRKALDARDGTVALEARHGDVEAAIVDERRPLEERVVLPRWPNGPAQAIVFPHHVETETHKKTGQFLIARR